MKRLDGGIRLESVSKQYRTPAGLVHAVDDVSLEVEHGSSLAVTGPSGCGKSTLLGLIGALEPPTAGHVFIGSVEVSSLQEKRRARLRREGIGFIFQSDNLLPFLTATENLGLQLALSGERDDEERCREALIGLGLAEHVDKLPDQLSRGQRQRVAVARALMHRPRVILADEPTGALDADNSMVVLDLLFAAKADLGATLVVVTHDPAVAQRLERTLSLRDGRLVDDTVEPRPRSTGV